MLSNHFSYLFDENVLGQFYMYRKMGYNLLVRISTIYNEYPYKFNHLKKFIRFNSELSNRRISKTMTKTLQFDKLFK